MPLCEVHSFCFVFRFVRIYIRGASFCCCCLLVCFSRYSILQTSLFTPSLLPLPFPVAERVKGKKRKKRSQAQALFNEKKNCFCSSLATHKILFLLVAFPLVWLAVFLSYCPLPPLDPSSNPLQLTPLAAACDTPLPSPPAPRHKSIRERETHVNWCACSFWGSIFFSFAPLLLICFLFCCLDPLSTSTCACVVFCSASHASLITGFHIVLEETKNRNKTGCLSSPFSPFLLARTCWFFFRRFFGAYFLLVHLFLLLVVSFLAFFVVYKGKR